MVDEHGLRTVGLVILIAIHCGRFIDETRIGSQVSLTVD